MQVHPFLRNSGPEGNNANPAFRSVENIAKRSIPNQSQFNRTRVSTVPTSGINCIQYQHNHQHQSTYSHTRRNLTQFTNREPPPNKLESSTKPSNPSLELKRAIASTVLTDPSNSRDTEDNFVAKETEPSLLALSWRKEVSQTCEEEETEPTPISEIAVKPENLSADEEETQETGISNATESAAKNENEDDVCLLAPQSEEIIKPFDNDSPTKSNEATKCADATITDEENGSTTKNEDDIEIFGAKIKPKIEEEEQRQTKLTRFCNYSDSEEEESALPATHMLSLQPLAFRFCEKSQEWKLVKNPKDEVQFGKNSKLVPVAVSRAAKPTRSTEIQAWDVKRAEKPPGERFRVNVAENLKNVSKTGVEKNELVDGFSAAEITKVYRPLDGKLETKKKGKKGATRERDYKQDSLKYGAANNAGRVFIPVNAPFLYKDSYSSSEDENELDGDESVLGLNSNKWRDLLSANDSDDDEESSSLGTSEDQDEDGIATHPLFQQVKSEDGEISCNNKINIH